MAKKLQITRKVKHILKEMTETMDKKKQIEEQTGELDVKLNRKLFTLMDLFDQAIETLPDLSKD